MIGKALYHILSNDSTLAGLVGTNIFPEIAPVGTQAPVIVFNVSNIVPEYSRSGLDRDASTVDVLCFAKDYTDCLDILTAARAALERVHGTFNTVQIQRAEVESITAGYDIETETFYQKLTVGFDNL